MDKINSTFTIKCVKLNSVQRPFSNIHTHRVFLSVLVDCSAFLCLSTKYSRSYSCVMKFVSSLAEYVKRSQDFSGIPGFTNYPSTDRFNITESILTTDFTVPHFRFINNTQMIILSPKYFKKINRFLFL